MAACGKKPAGPGDDPSPYSEIRIAKGFPSTVAAWEPLTLEAVLRPDDARILGEPRVSCTAGKIVKVTQPGGPRRLLIEYQPAGGSLHMDPNVPVSVVWTVEGKASDAVVVARGFVHVNQDGSYAFGYETPRPTIAEMAAPPIYQGPHPRGKG